MQNKEGEKVTKEDRVNIQFSVTSLLNYLAINAAARLPLAYSTPFSPPQVWNIIQGLPGQDSSF
jgi:hypothetical protein